MSKRSIWIEGKTRSGKTQRLSHHFQDWAKTQTPNPNFPTRSLILAANSSNRRHLGDRLLQTVAGQYPVQCQTLLGFMEAEVWLFWPLLMTQIPDLAPFPLKLRPETEQIWALALWQREIPEAEAESISATVTARLLRDSLDLMQLAGAAGIELETIPERLTQGWPDYQSVGCSPAQRGQFLQAWQGWCWQRGFLTYGLIYELYWRYLLPQTDYRVRLNQRFTAIFADDLDDYPAIALELFECLLDGGAWGVFTFSPDGKMRLGLNADPDYLETLARRCLVENLDHASGLAALTGNTILEILGDRFLTMQLPKNIQVIQTIARSKLLQNTANLIIDAVKTGEVKPEEIVIIAPGLDEIARYTLIQLLTGAGIPVEPLNEQRPLYSEALIRSLLTLLALIFPGLGGFALRDDVAEMLVILSQIPRLDEQSNQKLVPIIDPVRAGILADICYQLNPENPQLLPIETFARWDRLGYPATQKYQAICQWIMIAKNDLLKVSNLTPLDILHRAIAELLPDQQYLNYAQLAAIRELIETAQHFWEVEEKLGEKSSEFRDENLDFALNKT
ncbi:MAG: recombinase family protein, partial [Microcystaceae cyanobacterium]